MDPACWASMEAPMWKLPHEPSHWETLRQGDQMHLEGEYSPLCYMTSGSNNHNRCCFITLGLSIVATFPASRPGERPATELADKGLLVIVSAGASHSV